MIIVTNVSDEYSRSGPQKYEVRLNDITLSKFTHDSESGMAVCLMKAAESLVGVDIDEQIRKHRSRMHEVLMHKTYARVAKFTESFTTPDSILETIKA